MSLFYHLAYAFYVIAKAGAMMKYSRCPLPRESCLKESSCANGYTTPPS